MVKKQYDYQEICNLSDIEIDKLVFEKIGFPKICTDFKTLQYIKSKKLDVRWDWDEVGKVTVLKSENDEACNSKPSYASVHKNINRAIAEVILMIE